jgi:hypothetical protein
MRCPDTMDGLCWDRLCEHEKTDHGDQSWWELEGLSLRFNELRVEYMLDRHTYFTSTQIP